ncbi:hypothetical protein PUN28_010335 [Cardiocondyla obscurior]|uniref:Cytochrome b5 n=1 Tax=Cardiocondyla obscurior TaxID=286306 RepID=A0AAW2FQC3_9HYME
MTNVYTTDEIARHDNATDLWIVIHGVVYDVTAFHKEHPGGEEVLLQLAGQDATECFENVGHSPEAINRREIYKIGVLTNAASTDKSETTSTEIKEPTEDEWQYQEPKTEMQSWSAHFIGAVVVIYAVIIFYWYNKL